MASKEVTQTKKDTPPVGRSVMLTRFKLSQQKRQLREKEKINRPPQKTHALKNSAHTKDVAKDKKTKASKTTMKMDKEKETLVKRDEFCPNRLKRTKVAKKIVLKPKHELKVIGGTGGVKKTTKQQKGVKRKASGRKTTRSISVDSTLYESDNRSQSPVYSELGFEEMIRMADESQNLDDEDLNEILTCPSPVWWENPPDASYMEGPIIVKSNKGYSSPTLAMQCRSKQSRKKTPHKIILESSISKESNNDISLDVGTIIDNATLNNRNKSDVKFNKKRSKLESLLSTIKNNLSETKTHGDNNNIIQKKLFVVSEVKNIFKVTKTKEDDQNPHPRSQRYSISDSLEDVSFPEISIQDNDGLKHLENIKIPIEGKKVKVISQKRNFPDGKTLNSSVPFSGKVFNASERFKIIQKDLSKTIPRYVKNKKLKIINIKKMSPSFTSLKTQQNEKNISNLGIESTEHKSIATLSSKCDVNPIKNESVPIPEESDKIADGDNTSHSSSENGDSSTYCKKRKKISKTHTQHTQDNIKESILNNDAEENIEYLKVLKTFSPDSDKLKQGESVKKNHVEIKAGNSILSKYLTSVKDTDKSAVIEKKATDKSKLNSYYKKCKAARRLSKKREKDAIVQYVPKPMQDEKKDEENEMEMCDDCNSKSSIIVPSTEDIKYCLKCSSIFDMDESCSYCIRKEKLQQKKQHSSVAKSDSSDMENIEVLTA